MDTSQATDHESRRLNEVRKRWDAFDRFPVSVPHVTLATAILRAEKYCALAQEAALAPLELSLPRYEVLALLYFAEGGSMSLSQLSRATLMIPATVTYTADALQNNGLIIRVADPSDRRGVLAQITKAGRKMVERAFEALAGIEWGVNQFSAAEADQLAGLLSKMAVPEVAQDAPRARRTARTAVNGTRR